MTDRVVAPLRDFRQPLHDGLTTLQVAAAAVGPAETKVALAALDAAVEFLRDVFVPASSAEEFIFFPTVDGVVGQVGVTAVMAAQHRSLAAMAMDLESVVEASRQDGDTAAYARYLLPLLHGLYAAIRVHLESEDDAYVGLLDDHLSESQVGMLVDNLRRVAGRPGPVNVEPPR
jgi:hemerythrin-like domain-containing protein